jgi:hypothetical protein
MAEELVSYQHITSNPSLALTRAFHRMDECLMAGGKELEEELKRFAGAAEHGEDDAEVGERSKCKCLLAGIMPELHEGA